MLYRESAQSALADRFVNVSGLPKVSLWTAPAKGVNLSLLLLILCACYIFHIVGPKKRKNVNKRTIQLRQMN